MSEEPEKRTVVVDGFTFFNEMDLLEIRLGTLNPVVDYFVLVESTTTQTGKPKPLYYKENEGRYENYADKIIHVVVDKNNHSGDPWQAEHYQRDQIKVGLDRLKDKLKDDSYILISDADEIPDSLAIKWLQTTDQDSFSSIAFNHLFLAYYLNLYSPGKDLIGTILTKYSSLKDGHFTPQYLRTRKDYLPFLRKSRSIHASWLGGWEKVYEKLYSCVEPLDKGKIPPKEEFQKIFMDRILKDKQFNMIGEDNNTPLEILKDESVLPDYVLENREKYQHLFLKSW